MSRPPVAEPPDTIHLTGTSSTPDWFPAEELVWRQRESQERLEKWLSSKSYRKTIKQQRKQERKFQLKRSSPEWQREHEQWLKTLTPQKPESMSTEEFFEQEQEKFERFEKGFTKQCRLLEQSQQKQSQKTEYRSANSFPFRPH